MSYIGYVPAAKPLTSADITDGVITSAKIADSTIANADIANSTINLTQKVTGSLPVANGGTGLTALGTANQVLAVNSGATALEYQAVSSDFVLLATTTASSSASVSFDGYFSSTYRNYKIIISDVCPATNGTELRIRYRRSNADITASSYYWTGAAGYCNLDASVSGASDNSGAQQSFLKMNSSDLNNSNNIQVNAIVDIYDPLSTTRYKSIHWKIGQQISGNNYFYFVNCIGFLKDSLSALSGITFFMGSGNISTGNFKLYGIK